MGCSPSGQILPPKSFHLGCILPRVTAISLRAGGCGLYGRGLAGLHGRRLRCRLRDVRRGLPTGLLGGRRADDRPRRRAEARPRRRSEVRPGQPVPSGQPQHPRRVDAAHRRIDVPALRHEAGGDQRQPADHPHGVHGDDLLRDGGAVRRLRAAGLPPADRRRFLRPRRDLRQRLRHRALRQQACNPQGLPHARPARRVGRCAQPGGRRHRRAPLPRDRGPDDGRRD